MAIDTEQRGTMTGEEMIALSKKHTLFEWSAQSKVDPIPVARREGHLLLDAGGQALHRLQQPADVREHRPRRRARDRRDPGAGGDARLREPVHGDRAARAARRQARRDHARATSTSSSSPTAAPRRTRTRSSSRALCTGRHKILARYRSYHGGTGRRITLTGDPRRWAAEPGMPGVVHVLDPVSRHRSAAGTRRSSRSRYLEEVIQLEGPHTIAAFILETVTGTNGILVPPDGYLQGVRELCDKYGILMICDEVMAGFGRTGEWFAVDHWNVVPDIITMAKGLTSAYVQLGAVGMRRAHRRSLQGQGVLRRADLQQPSARLRRGAGDDRGLRGGRI